MSFAVNNGIRHGLLSVFLCISCVCGKNKYRCGSFQLSIEYGTLWNIDVAKIFHRGGGQNHQTDRRLFNFLKKKSYFDVIGSHFARVQNHLKEL